MKKSRTNHVIKNSWYGVANKVISLLLAFISRTIFIQELGAEYLGVDGLFANILTLLSLAELGIGNVLTFSLYRPISEHNSEKVEQLLNYYKKLYLYIALAVAAIGVIIIPFLKYIVDSSFSEQEVMIFYIFYLLNSVLSYVGVCYTTLIRAEQQQYIIDIIAVITKIFMVIAQIVVLLNFHSFIGYLIIMVCYTILQNILATIVAKRKYKIGKSKYDIGQQEKREIVKNVKATFLYKIGILIINYTDNILISVLLSTVYVGYYSNYAMIVAQVNGLIGIVSTAIIASVGNLSAENNIEKSQIVFNRLIYIYHMITVVCATCFIVLFTDFIKIWIGEANILEMGVVVAITFSFYVQNIINPVWMYREAYGLFDQIKFLMMFTAFFNLVLSIIGGLFWGITGIIGATGLARCLTTVWYEPKVLYKTVFKKSPKEYYLKQIRYVGVSIFIVIICLFLDRSIIRNHGLVVLLVRGVATVILSSSTFLLFTTQTEECSYWIHFMKDKLANWTNRKFR